MFSSTPCRFANRSDTDERHLGRRAGAEAHLKGFFAVGFVFGEQPGPCLATAQFIGTHPTDRIAYQAVAIEMEVWSMVGAIPPRPGVAIPKGG